MIDYILTLDNSCLLIAPEGIEIKYKHLLREGFKSF